MSASAQKLTKYMDSRGSRTTGAGARLMFAKPPRCTSTPSQPLEPRKSIPGYPNERQGVEAVLVTRQIVLIVPAAPSCETAETLAVFWLQSGVDEPELELVEPVEDEADVEAVPPPVEVDSWEPGPVGTGPASLAPLPPHPAATATAATTRMVKANEVLVMASIVRLVRNSSSLRR